MISLIFSLILFITVVLYSADYSKGVFNILNGDHLKAMHHQFGLHRNNVSSLLVLAAGIPYYFVVKSKNKWQLGLSLAILGLLFFDLLITRSRGSLLAFFLISVLVLITFWFKKIVNRKVIVACFATLFFSAFINIKLQSNATEYMNMLNPLYGVISVDGDDRLAMWKISYQLFKEKPVLGFGAGSWEFEYQKYGAGDLKTHHHTRSSHTHSHSYYVNVFFTVGIIGGLLFLVIMFLFPLQKLLGKLKNDEFELEDIVFFVGIIAFLIVSLFYGTTYNCKNILQGQPILFFIFLGCISQNRNATTYKTHLLVIILLLTATNFYYFKAWQNSNTINKFNTAFEQKKYDECSIFLQQLDNNKFGYLGYKQNINKLWYQVYEKQKKYGQATKSIKKALHTNPFNYGYFADLGDVLFFQKKYKPAIEAYHKALLYNCDYIPASIGLLKCEAALGNKKQVDMIKRSLLYIDDYIKQYQKNEKTWSQYKKLAYLRVKYNDFKKQVNKVRIAKKGK